MNGFIDSHAHLQSFTTRDLLFKDELIQNWQQVWKISQDLGIDKLLNIYDVSDDKELEVMLEMFNNPNIFISLAVHPCNVHCISLKDAQERIIKYIDKIHCIGETGLDIYNNANHIDIQYQYFKMHLEIAYKYNKPVSIHYRGEGEEFINILENILKEMPNITFVLHCCTYSWIEIERISKFKNCYISISGIVTYKKAFKVHDLACKVPIEKLLIETDSPFLTPEMNGIDRYKQNNQSSYIIYTYKKIAELRNISLEDLKTNVFNNFYKFLGI